MSSSRLLVVCCTDFVCVTLSYMIAVYPIIGINDGLISCPVGLLPGGCCSSAGGGEGGMGGAATGEAGGGAGRKDRRRRQRHLADKGMDTLTTCPEAVRPPAPTERQSVEEAGTVGVRRLFLLL